MSYTEDPIRKVIVAEYARRIIGHCEENKGDPALLSDQIAALIGILERAARDAQNVGNEDVASVAIEGSALLRDAALHLPVRSAFLLRVLAREPSAPDMLQTLFAT